MTTAKIRIGVLALGDGAVLITLRPHPAIVARLASLPGWFETAGPDRVAADIAGAAVWLTALWLAVGLIASLGSALPGALGRAARTLARATLPRTVYALAAGAAGVGVLLTCAGAQAAARRAPTQAALAAPHWPTEGPVRAPRWPTVAPNRAAQPPAQPPAQQPAHLHPAAAGVVVRRGDSLWRIAAAHLPGRPCDRRIAASWPRWYAANRQVIGSDPNVITPGEVLHAPHPAPTHESRS
jgi:nucleoid-associated protein YgaU